MKGRRIVVVAAAAAAVAAFVALAPTWVVILVVLAVAVVVSVWATRPPEVSMPRHVLALIGDAVLDVVRTALRAVVWVAVVVGLLVASWSYAGPRIAAGTAHLRDDAVAAVTPSLDLPSIHLPWRTEP